MIGTVKSVTDERQGGEVAVQAISGDTTLVLDDASDFEEDGGEFGPTLEDQGYAYTGVDYDTNTLTGLEAIGVTVAATLEPGNWIAPWSGDHEDTVRIAEVDTGDGPPLEARVPLTLKPLLPLGVREPGTEEQVEVDEMGDEVVVVSVRGRTASSIEFGGGAGNGVSLLAYKDYIELAERSADPNTNPPTGAVRIYSKVTAGTSKLYAQDDAGGVHALW